jgi:hypothetical protein
MADAKRANKKRRLPYADRRLPVTATPQTVIVGALSIVRYLSTAETLLNVVLS